MHSTCTNTIIDAQLGNHLLHLEEDQRSNGTNNDAGPRIDDRATSSNGDQAAQNSIAEITIAA